MVKEISVTELATMVKGKVIGYSNEAVRVVDTCAIDNYVPNKVSFVRNVKYGEMLASLKDAVVLIPQGLSEFCEKYPQNVYVIVDDVLDAMMDVQDYFYKDQPRIALEGIAETAKVDKTAKTGEKAYIGENVYIGARVVIGEGTKILHNCSILEDVTIGSNTVIYPDVCIYPGCQIGDDCLIDSGARIGSDGFRFEQNYERRSVRKWRHVGKVVIGNRVEIGANSCIDRATFEEDATIISDDVKIDNLVHVAHNAKIGARTLIIAQSCIGGSDRIGDDVWIGIGAAISNGVTVGNRAKVLLNAVVAYDVADDEIVSGFYAMPHRQWKQVYRKLRELDE